MRDLNEEDEQQQGRPLTSKTQENVQKLAQKLFVQAGDWPFQGV